MNCARWNYAGTKSSPGSILISIGAAAALAFMPTATGAARDGDSSGAAPRVELPRRLPPWERMNFGPAQFWTFEVAPGNIAYKGIAVRLDGGDGGVSKGRAWMIYDHDTLRVAAASTGAFVSWRGVAYDGSHGTHPVLTGEAHLVNPVGPGWADRNGNWQDLRLSGRDGLPYGPLPREWARYEGLYLHGNVVVLAMKVNDVRVLETPGWIEQGAVSVFTRTLQVGAGGRSLKTRVAPKSAQVTLRGDGQLAGEGDFWVATLPPGARTRLFISRSERSVLDAIASDYARVDDLELLTSGGPLRWDQTVATSIAPRDSSGPFVSDTLTLPEKNPWDSWMRPGGFDFLRSGNEAAVCTWNGDVWLVSGLTTPAGSLQWRRIATGLFQPLGLKVRDGEIFVSCRDQIARLRDLNGDGETDFIENFNNDHQVTEHFHEFAMGLQTDSAGNFYYAKSARHALKALVPQHGTLLRVSADGARTDILATGFRAANGVCLNDDGSFFVTDQEGHWIPKNRINRVHENGFYGNIFGYTSVTNTSDAAMDPPMVWITNAKDRSPAELLWVPTNAWGSLGGALLSLSYGTGKIFVVPHERVDGSWQGAVCELPLDPFPTGTMRGRFGSDGALYVCGLYGWAGSATAPGGFYRIRRTETPAHVPLAVHAQGGGLEVTFSDPLQPEAVNADAFALKAWSLRRSANYGSKHYDEQSLEIAAVTLRADGRTVVIEVPNLGPTDCYELLARTRGRGGVEFTRSLHGTIHRLKGL